MDVHQQQQFDLLLAQTGEAFIERIVQRCGGQENALAALRADRNADGVWLDEFVDAVFADWCLDNAEGATFVLCALQRRQLTIAASGTVGELLVTAAKAAYADLLHVKVLESMSLASVYG